MPYKNPEKQKQAQHESYLRRADRMVEYQRRVRGELRQKVAEYKLARGCKRCGYNRNSCALDAHHIQGKARINDGIAFMCHRRKSWEDILTELEKCEIVCANCHREEHDTR